MRALWSLSVVLVAGVVLPSEAAAGRAVRLMYEKPVAAAQPTGPAISIVFTDLRPPKKGGAEPELIGNERGQWNIPLAVTSGKGGTEHAATVVPAWAADCFRAAGYTASVGADPSKPTLNVDLQTLWSEQIPIGIGSRHETWVTATLRLTAAGSPEVLWERQFSASGGATTVMMRFDDPVEAGFVRSFDELTRALLTELGSDKFQSLLPGGNAAAALDAAESLGKAPKEKKSEGAAAPPPAAAGPEAAASAPAASEKDHPTPPAPFQTWDPEVYFWGGRDTVGALVFGGVATGLLIAGDQWGSAVARTHYGASDFRGLLLDSRHFTTTAGDPPVAPIAQAYVSEIFFDLGMQGVVPVFGSVVPSLVVAAAGKDLRTVKAVTGIAAAPSMIVTGVAHLNRFRSLYASRLAALENGAPEWLVIAPSVFSIGAGAADIAVGVVNGIFGVLYAAGVVAVDTSPGILPPVQNRTGLQNVRAQLLLAPNADGGVAAVLVGRF